MDSSCHARARGRAAKRRVLGAGAVGVVAAVAALAGPAAGAASAATTQSFTTPGQYSFTVPAGVSSISVAAVGGAGGACSGSAGGEGASVAGTFAVQPGEHLLVGVAGPGGICPGAGDGLAAGGIGGGGGGGGSPFTGAGGGGDSEVGAGLLPSYPASANGLLIVAAGGGGAGSGTQGGDAGAPGQAGAQTVGGAPGTATGGGAGGTDLSGTPDSTNGLAGTFGLGGAGGIAASGGGGGGGGGYYGGGGGSGSGGGGGSSFLTADASNTSGPTPTTAAPSVTITYQPPSVQTPTATFSTQSLKFSPSEPAGSISSQQTVNVSNTGTAPLVVSGVQTGGADPGDFLLDDRCQQPVAPGSSCQLGVRFAPQAKGSRTATLTVVTNAPTAPSPVALSGSGRRAGHGPAANRGSAGSGGQVVCRSGAHGTVACEIECAPGKYQIRGTSAKATFSVEQGDRVVAHGPLELKRGAVSHHTLRLKPGSYTLIISTGHGRQRHVLVRLPFRAP